MGLETVSNNTTRNHLSYFPVFPIWWRAAPPLSPCPILGCSWGQLLASSPLTQQFPSSGGLCSATRRSPTQTHPSLYLMHELFLTELPVSVLLSLPVWGKWCCPPRLLHLWAGQQWALPVSCHKGDRSREPAADPPFLLRETKAQGQPCGIFLRRVYSLLPGFCKPTGLCWSPLGLLTPPVPQGEEGEPHRPRRAETQPLSCRLSWG